MLKTLSSKEKPATVTHDERMRALQEQLNELKEKTLRTLRLTRITKGGVSGLLDSGATHPMRAVRKNEKSYKMVGDAGKWKDGAVTNVATRSDGGERS